MKIINSMAVDPSRFVKRPGVDFSRTRKCPFSSLILLILSMEASTLNREIKRFFNGSSAAITKSALIQQRKKLNDKAFPFLFSELNHLVPLKKKYKDYHLLAVDGSDTNIPFLKSDYSTHISSNTSGIYYDQVHLNAVFDILEKRFVDLIIQPRAEADEREAFLSFLSRKSIPEKSVFIADRGYASLNILAHLLHSRHSFLLRMKTPDSKQTFLSRFSLPHDAEFDIPLEISVTRSQKKLYKSDHEHYVCIWKHRRFDFIEPDDRISLVKLSFRLVKIELPDGNSEFLVTNLSADEFSKDDLKAIYRLRWEIETAFRFLKYNAALNSFHSIRRDLITQEIYARVILYNFTIMIVSCIQIAPKDTKAKLKISISDAIHICRDFLIHRIKNAEIIALLCRYLTEIRPYRTFPRKVRSKRVVPMMYRT